MGVKNEAKVPTITLTEAAQKAISEATAEEEGSLRLTVSPRFEYELSVDEERDADLVIDAGGIQVLVDRMSAKRADGVCIDFSEAGGGFRIDNPNEPPKVRELRPAELKKLLDGEDAPTLVDVRPAEERALAAIAGALPLDDAAETLAALDRDKPIAFYCHHGMRSRAAAERFLADGFRKVYNLGGGIEAWSRDVDPDVPRY
ncbi:MAG: rhodanese-like domain-containing protein [Myxococcales bacterium]|nr:rhodanese-like domain-containing protein [Myxococcales bacterium]